MSLLRRFGAARGVLGAAAGLAGAGVVAGAGVTAGLVVGTAGLVGETASVARRGAHASLSLAHAADAQWGGFGVTPKFPQPASVDLLLRHARRTGSDTSLSIARSALV